MDLETYQETRTTMAQRRMETLPITSLLLAAAIRHLPAPSERHLLEDLKTRRNSIRHRLVCLIVAIQMREQLRQLLQRHPLQLLRLEGRLLEQVEVVIWFKAQSWDYTLSNSFSSNNTLPSNTLLLPLLMAPTLNMDISSTPTLNLCTQGRHTIVDTCRIHLSNRSKDHHLISLSSRINMEICLAMVHRLP